MEISAATQLGILSSLNKVVPPPGSSRLFLAWKKPSVIVEQAWVDEDFLEPLQKITWYLAWSPWEQDQRPRSPRSRFLWFENTSTGEFKDRLDFQDRQSQQWQYAEHWWQLHKIVALAGLLGMDGSKLDQALKQPWTLEEAYWNIPRAIFLNGDVLDCRRSNIEVYIGKSGKPKRTKTVKAFDKIRTGDVSLAHQTRQSMDETIHHGVRLSKDMLAFDKEAAGILDQFMSKQISQEQADALMRELKQRFGITD
jgi:hypothetical protein